MEKSPMETANESQSQDGAMAAVRFGTCFCFLGLVFNGFVSAFLHWPAGFPHFCLFDIFIIG